MTTVIQKWGNSQGVRLPKVLLDEAHLEMGDEIEVSMENGSIVLRKVSRRKSLRELFEGYSGEESPGEIDWGRPEGHEVW